MATETKQPTVLVIGSTGFLGMEICRQLVAAGKKVKGLVRATSDEAKVAALQQLGVETVTGDIKDKLNNAFKGVNIVISTASCSFSRQEGDSIETVDKAGQLNVVKAAVETQVDHIIYISFNNMEEKFPLQDAKRAVEKSIMESGLTYTILQPTFFMEVWLSPHVGFDYPNAKANIYGQGKNQISWISLTDVASFAIASLDNPKAKNAVIELGGPEALSPLEVVKIFEAETGKPFDVQLIPIEALEQQKHAATDSLSKSFASLMLAYSNGSEINMETTIKAYPIKLTSVSAYAKRAATST
jgi:uncharacterized protein YbjT (DUF2867 family)